MCVRVDSIGHDRLVPMGHRLDWKKWFASQQWSQSGVRVGGLQLEVTVRGMGPARRDCTENSLANLVSCKSPGESFLKND